MFAFCQVTKTDRKRNRMYFVGHMFLKNCQCVTQHNNTTTKFFTKIRVRYIGRKWQMKQPVRLFTPQLLILHIVFHLFETDIGRPLLIVLYDTRICDQIWQNNSKLINMETKETRGNTSTGRAASERVLSQVNNINAWLKIRMNVRLWFLSIKW